jgi:asparagine synthase (glutamine-hydrolysing)
MCGFVSHINFKTPSSPDHFAEYSATLPVAHIFCKRVGKYLIKKLAERYFSAEFVHRRRMGFGVLLQDWLSGPLRPILEHTFRDAQFIQPLDGNVIETIFNEFLAGKTEHGSRLWALLMYGNWRNHLAGC